MSRVTKAAGARASAHSSIARALFADLMAVAPDVRRGFLAGLARDELEQVLAVADREGGTPYALWADDPVGFVTDVLGETLWSKSRQILAAIATSKRVAVPSAFGSSKTWGAARAALWKAFTNPVGTTKVVTLAPQWHHVHRQLWPEIRQAHARAGLPGTVDTAQLKLKSKENLLTVVSYGLAAPPWNETAVQGIHCFDDQTELLTDEGWKPFPQVAGHERVLTLNGDDAVWGPITQMWRHDFDGYLNLHDGVRVNFCITDNHRLPVRSLKPEYRRWRHVTATQAEDIKARRAAGESVHVLAAEYGVSKWHIYKLAAGLREGAPGDRTSGPRWRLLEYQDLPQAFILRRTNRWGGGNNPVAVVFDRPAVPYRKAEHYEFSYEDWCTFLGWFVAEGSVSQGAHGSLRIGISQKPGAKYEEIAGLLKRMGIRCRRERHDLRFTSDVLGRWLREHCGVGAANKRIPVSVKEARPEMIEAFLAAFGKGDGSPHNHLLSRRYMTSSKQLADDLHEVLCKLGRGRKMRVMNKAGSTSVMSTTGRAFARRHTTWTINDPGVPVDSTVLRSNIQRVRYTGKVYCVSTPHETIMVRRKGCPMWSGNSPRLLLIVDEAGGLAHTIGRTIRGMLVGGPETHMLAIGNPPTDEEGSWFEQLCETDGVLTIPIPAHETPNLSGEDAPPCRSCPPEVPAHSLATHLVDRAWVDETIRDHGEDSNYVQAKVYARFPKGGPDRALPARWVDDAAASGEPEGDGYARLCDLGLPDETAPWMVAAGAWIRLGVDVAADGGDELAISRCVGDLLTLEHTSSGAANTNPHDVAGFVLTQIRRAEALRARLGTEAKVRVKVDGIGVGWGVAGILRAWASEGIHDAEIVAVIVSEVTGRDPDAATLRPYRKRDEMWLATRSQLQPSPARPAGGLRLRLDRKTLAQLRTPVKSTNSSGYTVIEAKKTLKARGLPSPDRAESALLTVYEPAPGKRKKGKLIA